MSKPRTSLKFLKYADKVETYHAGDVIFREGEPGNVMYVVKAGTVDLRILDQTVETLEANSVLGEMALLDKEARSATAVAVTDCQLVPINAGEIPVSGPRNALLRAGSHADHGAAAAAHGPRGAVIRQHGQDRKRRDEQLRMKAR